MKNQPRITRIWVEQTFLGQGPYLNTLLVHYYLQTITNLLISNRHFPLHSSQRSPFGQNIDEWLPKLIQRKKTPVPKLNGRLLLEESGLKKRTSSTTSSYYHIARPLWVTSKITGNNACIIRLSSWTRPVWKYKASFFSTQTRASTQLTATSTSRCKYV